MTDLELDPGTGSSIARHHAAAARRIDLDVGPPAIDAGHGASDLMAILGRLLGTAAELALLSEVTALAVRAIGDELGTTDEQVGAVFERMRSGS